PPTSVPPTTASTAPIARSRVRALEIQRSRSSTLRASSVVAFSHREWAARSCPYLLASSPVMGTSERGQNVVPEAAGVLRDCSVTRARLEPVGRLVSQRRVPVLAVDRDRLVHDDVRRLVAAEVERPVVVADEARRGAPVRAMPRRAWS